MSNQISVKSLSHCLHFPDLILKCVSALIATIIVNMLIKHKILAIYPVYSHSSQLMAAVTPFY